MNYCSSASRALVVIKEQSWNKGPFSPKPAPYWSTKFLSTAHPRDVMVLMFGTQCVTFWYPHVLPPIPYSSTTAYLPSSISYLVRPPNPYLPLSLTLKKREGGGESARPSATITSHPRRPRVSVARPSDVTTDPSRRSRRADPLLDRDTNKIIKGDRRGRRAPRRQRSTVTVEGVSRNFWHTWTCLGGKFPLFCSLRTHYKTCSLLKRCVCTYLLTHKSMIMCSFEHNFSLVHPKRRVSTKLYQLRDVRTCKFSLVWLK